MKSTKSQTGYWVGFAIAFGFIAWAIARYDFNTVWSSLQSVNYWWIIPTAIIEMILIYIRAVRWRYFLDPIKKVSHYNTTMATAIGFLANMVLPARIGEFLRAWLIGKRESISKSAAMGTVVIERSIDGLSVVVLILIVLLVVDAPEEKQAYWATLKTTGYFVAGFYLTVFTALFLLYKRVHWVERVIDFSINVMPEKYKGQIRELLESFRTGFDVLASGHHMIAITIWSVVFWSIAGGLNIGFFHAFGLRDLPFIATYLVLMGQVIGVMIPSPGFVGPFHAATMAALAFYGVGEELALSMAIVMHATMFITNMIPGIVFLWLEKLSINEIKETAEQEEQ